MLVSVAAHAAQPGYCRRLGATPHVPARGAGDVLVTSGRDRMRVELDGGQALPTPVLFRGLSVGRHQVLVSPDGAWRPRQGVSFVVQRGRSQVVSAQRLGPAPSGTPPGLLIARPTDEPAGGAPRFVARRGEADELARLHCDPDLHPSLPSVTALLAATEAACARGDGPSCARAAEQWFDDVGVRRRDARVAVKRLDQACGLGVADACEAFARMLSIGNGIAKDAERGARLLETTCTAGSGHARSCATRGWALLTDQPSTATRALATPFLERACDLDSGYCGAARESALRLGCVRGDRGACELLDPGDSVRLAAEQQAGP